MWQLVLQPSGLINGILETLGLDRVAWLRDPTIALFSLIMVNVFKVLGFSMVLFLAALQTVPEDLREAARVDGASERHVFRNITLPLIAPFTFMVTILLTIASFKSFATNFLLTGGGPGLADHDVDALHLQAGSAALRDGLCQQPRGGALHLRAHRDRGAVPGPHEVGGRRWLAA